MRFKSLIIGCVYLSCFYSNPAISQTIDPIERAKMYPPSLLQQSDNEEAMSAIEWQIARLEVLLDQYQSSTNKISKSIDEEMQRRDELAARLPQELRMIDSSVRSQLIGKAMEELLHAKLDLATQAATIETLDKFSAEYAANDQDGEIENSQLEIRAAEMQLDLATTEREKLQALRAKNVIPESELRMATYTADIAKLELEKAIRQLEQIQKKPDREIASRITEIRVGIEPTKARIAAAEEFLKSFMDSAELVEKMERANEGIKAWNMDKRVVVGDLIQISRKLDELKVLKRMMESDLKNKSEKPAVSDSK